MKKLSVQLMADSTSKFSSVEIELDDNSFESKIRPNQDTPVKYRDFTTNIEFERPRVDDFGIIKSFFAKLRTPSDTTRLREVVFSRGDNISVIGKYTGDSVSFVESDSISPLISSKSISKILRKYRLAYLFQLYLIPVFCVGFSALLGYGAYL